MKFKTHNDEAIKLNEVLNQIKLAKMLQPSPLLDQAERGITELLTGVNKPVA